MCVCVCVCVCFPVSLTLPQNVYRTYGEACNTLTVSPAERQDLLPHKQKDHPPHKKGCLGMTLNHI